MQANPDNAAILAAIMGAGAVEQPTTFSPYGAPNNYFQQPNQFGAQQLNQQQPMQQQGPNQNYTDTLARFFSGPQSTFGQINNIHRSPVGSDGLTGATHMRIPAHQRIFFDGSNT